LKRYLSSLLIACLLTSCATIKSGRDEVIAVDSDPSGATATIKCNGNISTSGTTPAKLTIARKADGCRVNVEKIGMKPQSIELERGFNRTYWINFIPVAGFPLGTVAAFAGSSETLAVGLITVGIVGGVGLIVDRITGAMYDHNPNVIKVTLQPEQ
jgi:hypothetical protein